VVDIPEQKVIEMGKMHPHRIRTRFSEAVDSKGNVKPEATIEIEQAIEDSPNKWELMKQIILDHIAFEHNTVEEIIEKSLMKNELRK